MIMLPVGRKVAGISVGFVPSPPEEQFDNIRDIVMRVDRKTRE
jgi:hypothetical protein